MSKRIAVVGRIKKRNGKVVFSTVKASGYTGVAWGKGNGNVRA